MSELKHQYNSLIMAQKVATFTSFSFDAWSYLDSFIDECHNLNEVILLESPRRQCRSAYKNPAVSLQNTVVSYTPVAHSTHCNMYWARNITKLNNKLQQ